jgi:hypothetical protein
MKEPPMKEILSLKIAGYEVKIADIHIAVAAALVIGILAVAALR